MEVSSYRMIDMGKKPNLDLWITVVLPKVQPSTEVVIVTSCLLRS